MDLDSVTQVDRATWRRYLFYIDLVVIAIFAIALILLVRHSFVGGQLYANGDFDSSSDAMWLVVGDTAFLVAALGWIFYRFFRNQYLVLTRRF